MARGRVLLRREGRFGADAWFFLDQFVMKMAEQGMKFSWPQDSGYIPYPHRPYVTIWCPHVAEAGSNDRVGYHGDDPGIPAILKAGDAAVFSSTTFHRSGPNTTRRPRRVMLLQYSAEPILEPDGRPRHWADPFLARGERTVDAGLRA